jgi:DNA primase
MSQSDQVRTAADIVKVVGDYVKLRKAGANFMGLCPFHQEKTPSFAVHPTKQIFHCFGCGVGGDVFKFVMLIENLSFPEALGRVAEKAGVPLRGTLHEEGLDARGQERTALYKLHTEATKFYAGQLGASAEGRAARAYLTDRGLTEEVIGRFRIGYAPADGQGLTRRLRDAAFSEEILEKSGLILRDTEGRRLFDRFRRRIMFPIANESGKVAAFGGRALGDDQPKYMNSPETPIYSKGRVLYHLDRAGAAIRKLDYAILVEGYMDCIAVASAGIENVVATCGTSLTETQVRLLARYSRRVVVNFDPDSAGVAATERSLNLLLEEGFEVKVLALPKGLDPDAFLRQEGAAAYRDRLVRAPTYLDYLTERAAAQHDLERPEGKVAAVNAVLPYLVRVPNAMLRAELANRLSERLRVDERLLGNELRRAAREGRRDLRAPEQTGAKPIPAEKELLRAFLENEEFAVEFLPKIAGSGVLEGLALEPVFRRLLEMRQRSEKVEWSRLEEGFSAQEQSLIYECAFSPGEPSGREAVEACYEALWRRKMERERGQLQAAIEEAEKAKDTSRLSELMRAKTLISQQLAGKKVP